MGQWNKRPFFSPCRNVSLSSFESLRCNFVWVVFTSFLCSCWMDGGQSETVLQGSPLRGMHAWRLGLSVLQPVSSQASSLHTCGSPVCFDTLDAVSLNNTSFIPPSSSSPVAPPTSSPFLPPPLFLYVLLSLDTGSFEMNHFLLFFFFYFAVFILLLVLAETSTRKYLKLGSTSFLSVIFFFFFSSLCTLHQMCELWGATGCLLSFILTWFYHHMHYFFSIFQLFGITFKFFLKIVYIYPSVEHTEPLMKTMIKGRGAQSLIRWCELLGKTV